MLQLPRRKKTFSYTAWSPSERLDKLDLVAEDLINSLSPSRPLANSWPGREHTSYIAGFYTNAWYGIVVGFFFFGMVALLIYLRTMTPGGA